MKTLLKGFVIADDGQFEVGMFYSIPNHLIPFLACSNRIELPDFPVTINIVAIPMDDSQGYDVKVLLDAARVKGSTEDAKEKYASAGFTVGESEAPPLVGGVVDDQRGRVDGTNAKANS